jgi:HK97 family phage prohead protease
MNRKFLDQAAFREAARAGRAAGASVERAATMQRVATDGTRTVRWVLSDGSVDRMGDTIDPAGWNLAAFKKNPVVLFAHDSNAPPIGRLHGPWIAGGQLVGDVEFADAEIYPFADEIYRLVQNGFIRAGSVGFLPIRYEFSNDRPGGIDFLEQELIEFSITPVPANANALVQARAKGLNTAPLWGVRSGGGGSHRVAAKLRRWAREAARSAYRRRGPSIGLTEEDLAGEKHLARERLRDAADMSTQGGRAHYVRRLRAFYAANGGRLVDRRAAAAEAAFRTAPRW